MSNISEEEMYGEYILCKSCEYDICSDCPLNNKVKGENDKDGESD